MNRIDHTFQNLRKRSEKAFVAYVAAGDPDFERSLAILKALADAGADVLELGVPFSDPLADGVVNQMAADRALKAGMSTQRVLDLISAFRQTHQTPIVLFTYLNPVYAYGYESFLHDGAAAGADGILLLDLPPDEAELNQELKDHNELHHIQLIAPTTPPARRQMLAQSSQGFIYALSRTGVTGSHGAPSQAIGQQVADIKQHTETPVCVGFGINTPDQAKMVASHADGIIVGSAIVHHIEQHQNAPDLPQRLRDFVTPLITAAKS